jgi:hypothetical protein
MENNTSYKEALTNTIFEITAQAAASLNVKAML